MALSGKAAKEEKSAVEQAEGDGTRARLPIAAAGQNDAAFQNGLARHSPEASLRHEARRPSPSSTEEAILRRSKARPTAFFPALLAKALESGFSGRRLATAGLASANLSESRLKVGIAMRGPRFGEVSIRGTVRVTGLAFFGPTTPKLSPESTIS